MLYSNNLLTAWWQVCCLNLQAEADSSSKDLQKLERSLQVQQSDLKALQHHLDEKDSMVGSNKNGALTPQTVYYICRSPSVCLMHKQPACYAHWPDLEL